MEKLTASFPLKSLLYLHYTAKYTDTYIDNFEGFKLLVKWLGPIEYNKEKKIEPPRCFETYEMQRIAYIVQIPIPNIYAELIELYFIEKRGR